MLFVDRCEDMEFFCALNRLQLLHNATVTVVTATADCEREEEFEVWLDACRANVVSSRDFIESYISPIWQGNVSLLGSKVSLLCSSTNCPLSSCLPIKLFFLLGQLCLVSRRSSILTYFKHNPLVSLLSIVYKIDKNQWCSQGQNCWG